jgi:hypothetical protein
MVSTEAEIVEVTAEPEATAEPGPFNEPELILANDAVTGYSQPRFAPNINALLVTVSSPANIAYAMLDPVSGELVSVGQYEAVNWMADGRILAFGENALFHAAELAIVDLAATPPAKTTVFSADSAIIYDARVTTPSTLGMIVADIHRAGPSALRLVETPVTGGDAEIIADIGVMLDPIVSPDGGFVAGLTFPEGKLVIYNVTDGGQTALRAPNPISDFRWSMP